MKTPELIGAGKECFISRRHKLPKLAAAYAVRPCGSKGFLEYAKGYVWLKIRFS
jgi:hypothetical protein